ncbi:MAG: response regulator transcription factor [Candidatus Omnitrophota bacterium]
MNGAFRNLSPIRICIVDDHLVVVEGLTYFLHNQPNFQVCGSARSASDGLRLIREMRPDVAIVDLSLNNSSGLDLIKDLQYQSPEIPAIVLSMHDELIYAERAIRLGAKGYIMKDRSFETVVDAIHAVLRKEIFISDAVKNRIMNRLAFPLCDGGNIAEALTDREQDVFRLIGQGLRPRHIAEKLNVSVNTVETHCRRIREKLELNDMKAVIEAATAWLQQNPSNAL